MTAKPLKSLQGKTLQDVPPALLEIILAETEQPAHGTKLKRRRPFFQIVSQALDFVSPDVDKTIKDLLDYLYTDVTCFWHTEPADLRLKEEQAWGSLHQILSKQFGCSLETTSDLTPPHVHSETYRLLNDHLHSLSVWQISALMTLCRLTSSLVIPLALLHGHLNAEQAWESALLEEQFQNQRWGLDEEAEYRQQALKEDLKILENYLNLL